jgi:hypothetical protein
LTFSKKSFFFLKFRLQKLSFSLAMQPATIVQNRVARVEIFRACISFSAASIGMLLANKGVVLGLSSPWLLILIQNLVSSVFFMFKMTSAQSSVSRVIVQHSVRWIPAVLLFTV